MNENCYSCGQQVDTETATAGRADGGRDRNASATVGPCRTLREGSPGDVRG